MKYKQLRMKRGIKQLSLSKASGLHATTISLIENGWMKPNKDQLTKLKTGYRKLGVRI